MARILASQRPSGRRVWASWGKGGFEVRKGKGGVSLDRLVGPERKGEGQRARGALAGASRQAETPPSTGSITKHVHGGNQ